MSFLGVPNARSKNVLIHWILQKHLKKYSEQYFKGVLVDIGCGNKPYKELLKPYIKSHIGLDHKDSFHSNTEVDIFGTAYDIPVDNDYADSALCSAVLEHLEEPQKALEECYRILKPNGVAIYTIPFIWHIHEEPRDFFRYSNFGIEYLFQKTGFEIEHLDAMSGFWTTFGQLFIYKIQNLNRGPLRWFKIVDLFALVIQLFAYVLDKIDRDERWTWMYIVVAKKP